MARRYTSPEPDTRAPWRVKLHEVIFGAESRAGRFFDIVLIVAILLSVGIVMLESVASMREEHGLFLRWAEWTFTVLFTVEYALRLLCVRRASHYATSFFGIVDLLAILPTYLALFVPGAQYFLVVRMLRILRIFRVLKLVQYLEEADLLLRALRASRRKITVFIFAVVTLNVIFGALMYFIEGAENGFTSIPRGVYWAIVTLTTVGFGDISPQTGLGQAVAAVIMILGYGIIAVPTGIVTSELTNLSAQAMGPQSAAACPNCGGTGHDADAKFCKHCGHSL